MTGKPGAVAVLAIGVWQQSVYQRKTLLERRMHPMASAPAVSFTRPGRHLEDVRSTCRVEHVRPPEEKHELLAVLAIADDAQAT